jgi:hypothetical protein
VIRLALKEIGVLWRKEGKKGSYLTGTLDIGALGKVNIAVFQNEKGKGDNKKPDARIMLFEDD